ncbi:MAG: VacJ family lipoprotein [Sphingomonas bacterium]
MSLGLVLPTIALLGATPEKTESVVAVAPAAQVQSQTDQQATPPAPPTSADQTAAPAIPLDPLVDPAGDAAVPDATASPVVIATAVGHAPGDPLEGLNRHLFAGFQFADRTFIRPVAMGYRHVVPKPVRSGLRNFFRNLGEPLVFLNDLLQLKPGRAFKTFERFVINSSLGIGGLIDVAKSRNIGLPHHDNGFGNTLGYYGVGPGPYLFLPIIGPTTLRDLIGGQGDDFVLPIAIGNPFDRLEYQIPRGVLSGIDDRAELDADFKALLDSAVDPYATLRSVYLQNRAAEIQALHSRSAKAGTTTDPLDDPLGDPAARQASPLDDPLNDPAASPATPTETAPADSFAPAKP